MAEVQDTERILEVKPDTFCGVVGSDTPRIIPGMEWYEVAKRRMKDLKLQQEDFIEPLGIRTRGAVGHYFTGRRTPTPAQFKTIASMLGMSMDELFNGSSMQLRDSPASAYLAVRPDTIVVPQLNLAPSMGTGVVAPEHIEVVESIRVHLPRLKREVHFTAPNNLRIITGYGDSMQPTFNDGDPLLIDVGVTDIRVDGVYVLERESELFIKRVQRQPLDGTLKVISDNKNYESFVVKDAERTQFRICGRVLLAWNSRKL